ncbi:uncharacterized protein EV422DRAFT_35788 [Fimicolochytrium jonesii]|uniref:uncharacterized protein n=1 Tax=Fimicolochytrium jonesii TaxID=1396493 RepID=UPI0022FE413D|nr:uncharacterized protein EV422DRAFT_35788 [Fimicolochytrium jonesii]KAI8821272.1 hypothetical protein EV422DRAFT_35788 [Fimicolochytrium jonesii]
MRARRVALWILPPGRPFFACSFCAKMADGPGTRAHHITITFTAHPGRNKGPSAAVRYGEGRTSRHFKSVRCMCTMRDRFDGCEPFSRNMILTTRFQMYKLHNMTTQQTNTTQNRRQSVPKPLHGGLGASPTLEIRPFFT